MEFRAEYALLSLSQTLAQQIRYCREKLGWSQQQLAEKLGTKQGWSCPSPDEDWVSGYPHEMEAFYRTIALGEAPQSDSRLAADAISTIYSAYVSAEQQGVAVPIKV